MSRPLRLVPQAARTAEFCCPLCSSTHAGYVFGVGPFRIYRCGGCALTFREPPASSSPPPFQASQKPSRDEKNHPNMLAALAAAEVKGPTLVVADQDDELVSLLERCGTNVARVAGTEDFGPDGWGQTFDAAIVSYVLMRATDPCALLTKIHTHLSPGAPIVISLPLLDGYQARLLGRSWHEWHFANRWYFTKETLSLLLLSSGFDQIWFEAERRRYSVDTLLERLHGSGQAAPLQNLQWVRRLLPAPLRSRPIPLPHGTVVITATAAPASSNDLVSIIVPAYNEQATFQEMMDALLAKQIDGMRKEIIIVESNSTDGTRELAKAYADHPEVKLLLQAAPRGKGNAVRDGLKAATGDILLIQDADLEYDIDDYDGLLAPLVAWQSMFILGSRHQGGWKMRQFNDAPVTAAFFNLGHSLFRSMINVLLGTRMTDPFTMFKVFRRDALHGMELTCNRFDFDIELVIKLVRKGYVPIEVPVNYVARSFAEGKKVSVTRDGLTWVWTILKARFAGMGARRQSDAE